MTYFITIAGRRWPVETTFKTGKDVFGWDQTQVRTGTGSAGTPPWPPSPSSAPPPSATRLTGSITLPADTDTAPATHARRTPAPRPAARAAAATPVSDADLQIPLGDAPVPVRAGQPCPPELGPIKLSIAETTRLTDLAACYTKGLITRARLAFALRWSLPPRAHGGRCDELTDVADGHRQHAPCSHRAAPHGKSAPRTTRQVGR